ncbi:MAG: VOC family protein [Rhodospirillaceae bacterium]
MTSVALVTIVVRDYDEAIAFYRDKIGFRVADDTPLGAKRWVVLESPEGTGARILLARASGEAQTARVGDQTGGRVFMFLHTDDFDADFAAYTARGVNFVRPPRREAYGTVAVFTDLYGNLWDLIGSSQKV